MRQAHADEPHRKEPPMANPDTEPVLDPDTEYFYRFIEQADEEEL